MRLPRQAPNVKNTGRDLPIPVQLGLATFGILALELATIRWAATQIRIFAYFNNLILIAAFLGMGLGVALGKRKPNLVHATLPLLALLCAILALATPLGYEYLGFPDLSVALWGGEFKAELLDFIFCLAMMLFIFWIVVALFLSAGTAVGVFFARLCPLKAYSWDLIGSLAGVLVLAAVTWVSTPPPVWFLVGGIPFVILSRRLLSVLALGAVVALTTWSVQGAVFSPYNRIDLSSKVTGGTRDYIVAVNRDFHQFMHDLSPAALSDALQTPTELHNRSSIRKVYDLPFMLGVARGRALVAGAGTGNDVAAAMRCGFSEVQSVDIDGQIVEMGRRLHPEKPYQNPAVSPIVNDARAYFEQYGGDPFDVVCYGLLDSHAMFSSLSSLRLENYVYTREGLGSAWQLVGPKGYLTLAFSVYAGDWIAERIYWTLAEATHTEPVVIAHHLNYGYTFIAARDLAQLDWKAVNGMPRWKPEHDSAAVRKTSDDWPFLYVRPGTIPWGYLVLIFCVLASGSMAVRFVFRGAGLVRDFDLPMFFMGMAFLLLETRGVTNLSLLFGSTWQVNASVFAGVLVMALAANLLVDRRRPANPGAWFIPLLASMVLLIYFRPEQLNAYPLLARGCLGGVLNALPIGIAGVIVSILLARSTNATASLASNLLGALVGGCLEYFSMWAGLRALAILALIIYILAWLALRREAVRAPQPA
jgi:hypothetical protein